MNNNSKKIMAFLVVMALACMPVFAQRSGGNNNSSRSGSSVSRSSSPSSSRSSVSSSRSSSSSNRSSVSSSSRSSSSNRSVSTPRSSSSNRSAVNRSTPSSSRSSNVSSSRNTSSRSSVSANSSRATSRDLSASRSSSPASRNGAVNRNGNAGNDNRRGTVNNGNGIGRDTRGNNGIGRNNTPASGRDAVQGNPAGNVKDGGARHLSTGNLSSPNNRFATPDKPHNPMPPSHRPMHPAPYFHHPHHHGRIHMHVHPWHRVHFEPVCWPGLWHYCNNYWYDYHVTNTVVVTNYVRETYNANLVSYAISGNLMYAIIDDVDGNTYLKVFDSSDNLLAIQEISRKYITMEIDRENGGCWIFKKKDKDPMLFLYVNGELLIYEAD